MPRVARIVAPGYAHHITQRGNNRQDIFFVDDDRAAYLRFLKEESELHGLRVLGYCLMTNHVHIIAIPEHADSLKKAIGRTHWRYTQYVNRLHGRSGHLWQNRFFSCFLDDAHLISAKAYIELNPVRAKMVRHAWLYKWSSATAHIEGVDEGGLIDIDYIKEFFQGIDWKERLRKREDENIGAALRLSTSRGRPLGSDSFLSKVEKKLGRRIRPLPVGRPKKEN